MGRFASTVDHYERARQPYGPAFFAAVARRLPLGPGYRLLDLGTGPGLLALGFAPHVGAVWGVDPEPAMLAAARRNAAAAGIDLRLVAGRAEDLPADIGAFDVVTVGRALHWMEPAATRDALHRVVAPAGVVVVASASTASDGRNPWIPAYEAARARWSGRIDRAKFGEREAYFGGTRFRPDGEVRVEAEHRVPLATLAERILSMSSTSPDAVGEDVDALRAEAERALTPFAVAGSVVETVVARAELFRSAVPF